MENKKEDNPEPQSKKEPKECFAEHSIVEHSSDCLDGIIKFQRDRLLSSQEHSTTNETINILEELLELDGYDVPKEKRGKLYVAIDSIIDKLELERPKQEEHYQADAYADIIVFAVGALMKLGYNPKSVIREVSHEINSREGQIVDGKFQKYTTAEYTSKWYKANLQVEK